MSAALLFAMPAAACPNCAVGNQARSEVWSQGFWFHLLVALLPFLVIGWICIYVEERDRSRDVVRPDANDGVSHARSPQRDL